MPQARAGSNKTVFVFLPREGIDELLIPARLAVHFVGCSLLRQIAITISRAVHRGNNAPSYVWNTLLNMTRANRAMAPSSITGYTMRPSTALLGHLYAM